jgi:hypothetical protein
MHVHGVLALLPRQSSADDEETIQFVKNFVSLRNVAASQFMRATDQECPLSAMYYADTGSGNYPAVLAVVRVLTAAFFFEEKSVAANLAS